jgi:hypothetical protein
MALVFDGPVAIDALTEFVRNVPTPADQVLNRILPDREVGNISVDIAATLTRTNRTARFRAWDGRIHVSQRDVVATSQVRLPPLSSSLSVGEYERLQIEYARTGGTNMGGMIDAIYNDADQLTREIRARMEQARGDVLLDGKFTLGGEGGLVMEADYLVPAGNFVAPGTLWSTTATATVVEDMSTWVTAYITLNGFAPGSFVTSTRVKNYMLSNAGIRTLAASLGGTPNLVTRPTLDAVLNAFSLPPLAFTYDTKVDVDGVTTNVLPDDRVIFLPPNVNDLGYTAWGVTATSLELVNSNQSELSFADAPGIVGVIEKEGPPYRQYTFVDAVGMPVLTNPKLLMVADVA